jgi:hypothetical protein
MANAACRRDGPWTRRSPAGSPDSGEGKRQLDHGEASQGMTVAQAARLTALGLFWDRHEDGAVGGAPRAAGSVQGGARRMQRANTLGRGNAACQLGPQPVQAQAAARPRRAL